MIIGRSRLLFCRTSALKRLWGAAFLGGLTLTVALLTSERWSLPAAEMSARRAAQGRALTSQGFISSQLQKYRLLPLVLADYPYVQNALDRRTTNAIGMLNERLRLLAERTDAAEIYVVAANGLAIASSNSHLPTSFVGQNYSFRPYFTGAMKRGSAEQFALGTVSKRPGLYLARRAARGAGVVVVKVEFDRIEASWSRQAAPTILRDENGVVIITNRRAWRLHTTSRLSPAARASILQARLYGDSLPLAPTSDMPLGIDDKILAMDDKGRRYVTSTLPVPLTGWTLSAVEPLEPFLRAATAEFRAVALMVALVLLVVAGLWARTQEARSILIAAQQQLEHQVELRTAELRSANELLVRESRERERNEQKLQAARDELAQSNRLATLGQITAGVAHEINQPLAALRTFAENAHLLLDRGRTSDARANIGQIVSLSDRIGDITAELRLFARREGGRGPVALNVPIDGALLLISDRLRQMGVVVVRVGAGGDGVMIAADRVRIEQILVNLLQNAADAVADSADPRVSVRIELAGDAVKVSITDNGVGISRKARRDLFKSFVTQKPNGLGLGLVISRDLAREIGGELIHQPGGAGTTFQLSLPLA